ncbi:MAG TPA: hypothetical protein DF774_08350 [Rheinheimera sp.]|uniref:flagellar hook-basal body complex protein n=1 Tax=Rheinheimera sp. TaxID=1869214 RepID=UPI000EE971D1|nr:flagellar hook-basal body complex protein [Rheinheimera sp.]HCU65755.1 hypothetical protein [Rheinheimera sp.]
MTDVIQSLDAAFGRDVKHINNIAHNVANINTPGFQHRVSFDAFQPDQTDSQYAEVVSNLLGGIRQTHRSLDIAILDEGYFLLERNGQQFLSKDGRLHLDPQGYLSNASGARVVTDQGLLRTDAANLTVRPSGEIVIDGKVSATLRIVNGERLQLADSGLLLSSNIYEVKNIRLQNSALNVSTVNPTSETVRMMEVSRHLQSVQKAAAAYDQMLQNGINEIGKK